MTRRNVGIAMMMLGIIIIVITFMMNGCSCSMRTADEEKQPANTRFHASVDHNMAFNDFLTVVDKRTGVEYLLFVGPNKAAITMLVNADGTARTGNRQWNLFLADGGRTLKFGPLRGTQILLR